MLAGAGLVSGEHCAPLKVGAEPCPEDDMLKLTAFVMLSQTMAMLNSREMAIVEELGSAGSLSWR